MGKKEYNAVRNHARKTHTVKLKSLKESMWTAISVGVGVGAAVGVTLVTGGLGTAAGIMIGAGVTITLAGGDVITNKNIFKKYTNRKRKEGRNAHDDAGGDKRNGMDRQKERIRGEAGKLLKEMGGDQVKRAEKLISEIQQIGRMKTIHENIRQTQVAKNIARLFDHKHAEGGPVPSLRGILSGRGATLANEGSPKRTVETKLKGDLVGSIGRHLIYTMKYAEEIRMYMGEGKINNAKSILIFEKMMVEYNHHLSKLLYYRSTLSTVFAALNGALKKDLSWCMELLIVAEKIEIIHCIKNEADIRDHLMRDVAEMDIGGIYEDTWWNKQLETAEQKVNNSKLPDAELKSIMEKVNGKKRYGQVICGQHKKTGWTGDKISCERKKLLREFVDSYMGIKKEEENRKNLEPGRPDKTGRDFENQYARPPGVRRDGGLKIIERMELEIKKTLSGGDCLFYALKKNEITPEEIARLRKRVAEIKSNEVDTGPGKTRNGLEVAGAISQTPSMFKNLTYQGKIINLTNELNGRQNVTNEIYSKLQKIPGVYSGEDELEQWLNLVENKTVKVTVIMHDGNVRESTAVAGDQVRKMKATVNPKLGGVILYKSLDHWSYVEEKGGRGGKPKGKRPQDKK